MIMPVVIRIEQIERQIGTSSLTTLSCKEPSHHPMATAVSKVDVSKSR